MPPTENHTLIHTSPSNVSFTVARKRHNDDSVSVFNIHEHKRHLRWVRMPAHLSRSLLLCQCFSQENKKATAAIATESKRRPGPGLSPFRESWLVEAPLCELCCRVDVEAGGSLSIDVDAEPSQQSCQVGFTLWAEGWFLHCVTHSGARKKGKLFVIVRVIYLSYVIYCVWYYFFESYRNFRMEEKLRDLYLGFKNQQSTNNKQSFKGNW